MRTSKIISLSLPPKIYEQAKQVAEEEGRTTSELFREALRQYIQMRLWKNLQSYGMLKTGEHGIKEDDVERLVDEFRKEQG
ncbi:MAG: ribbon-helix-helix protein, CopG family [Candidatus Eremiobacteraeota bacterium]|nr:ribbon-helix-helix protein, CopG family [Candidatus Eremiobacteraeota bacterium]